VEVEEEEVVEVVVEVEVEVPQHRLPSLMLSAT
jgi:hypothetical protein